MSESSMPLPAEPLALKTVARTLLEQAPETGLPLVLAGAWLADPLWERWGDALERRGMEREQFDRVVAGYGNELRLWVVGERPWAQVAAGLAGRVTRRLPPQISVPTRSGPCAAWQEALGRVDLSPDADLGAVTARIGDLQLLHEIAAPNGRTRSRPGDEAVFAVVWAGGRPRDPEVPFGEGRSGSSAAALTEALGRFLLKDPAYPPR